MFLNFFRRNRDPFKWNLKPRKFPKNDQNNFGGKCNLPENILSELLLHEISPPYTFEISHTDGIFSTNCGVLEFTEEEGIITVPEWMFQQLDMFDLGDTGSVKLKLKSFPKGKYAKLLPHSVEFLEIENPKSELEKTLRNYQVLTQGDEIICRFIEPLTIRFTVSETKPSGNGIYIVDTDLEVEFLPPIGYEEKIEKERSVIRFLKIFDGETRPRAIEMTQTGLFFNFKEIQNINHNK